MAAVLRHRGAFVAPDGERTNLTVATAPQIRGQMSAIRDRPSLVSPVGSTEESPHKRRGRSHDKREPGNGPYKNLTRRGELPNRIRDDFLCSQSRVRRLRTGNSGTVSLAAGDIGIRRVNSTGMRLVRERTRIGNGALSEKEKPE